MNKIYKVIWSHVKQCYVVTSELAKAHGRTSTRGRTSRLAVAALTAFILTAGVTSVGLAADKDIVDKGAQPIAYDINPANDGTNIAVGKNAKVFIGGGTQESMLSFGEKVHEGIFSMHIHDNNHAKQNLPEGIAVGTNSYARTGSIEIGAHTLGKNNIKIGDATVSLVPEKDANGNEKKDSEGNIIYKESLPQFGVGSTTLGTNSYTGGGFATTIGSYNVQSSPYEAKDPSDTLSNATKNAFATVIGTFNSNESMKGGMSSGVANMIAGTANKVTNSNGAIVMGAGNSVKGSSSYFDASAYSKHFDSVTDMQKALMDGVASSAGGATLVIGGANQAENTSHSQIMGVGNSMKSTTYKKVQYNYLDGFDSHITDASHVKVLGQSVTINKGANSNTVIGDNRTVAENQTNNVIIGNADEKNPITTEKKETVILGYKANAKVDGGVAIGSGSIANVGAGQKGYYVKHDQRSEEGEGYPFQNNEKYKPQSAWISRAGAVSVGDTTNEDQSKWITRQITGVAAGTKDTDAVNVAQLKNSQTRFYSIYDPGDDWLGIFPQIPNWEKYKNADNQGAQGYWSMAAGFGTSTGGIASTVIGSLSKIDNKWTDGGPYGTQGATAVSIGTLNLNLSDQVTEKEVNSDDPIVTLQDKEDSGVANSIVGQANLTKNSNGALIYGAGNIVTDSYRRVFSNGDNDWDSLVNQDMESLLSNPEKTIKTIGKIADISGGKAMVIGGGNVVDKAYDSQVMGVGNTVTGSNLDFAYKESPEIGNITDQFDRDAAREADVWTQYMESIRKKGTLLNLVDGYYSTLKNGQNDYLIGTANEVTGDDASKNKSNIVFGDYHKLNNGSNNIIIGSADGAVVEKAKGYNEDDEYGIKTSQEVTGQKQHTENLVDAVMIGHNADVQKNGGVALGAGSVASVDKGAVGYDLANGDHSKDTTGVWKSKAAAVSVGQIVKNEQGQLDAEKTITRQITGVAAGSEDTDAVNVAQLKAISSAINTDITASKTHFYSVNSTDEKAKNYDNKGATAANALAAGVGAQALKDSAVAIGDAAHAESSNSVVIGTGAWTRSSNGDKPTANGGDVAIGQKAYIDSYVNQGGSIALGQNARVENTNGSTERKYAFGQTEFEGDNIPLNPGNEAGGVAIGRNSFARTGSLMVGSHMYKGAIADMDEVDGTDSQKLRDNFNNINMTTLGTNSFNNGTFATVTGSYSATTAKKKTQNFAATMAGSLNSIESYKDADDNSGVASSIVGTANRIANSNNTTILGAGNEVTNSLADITAPTDGGASAKALQDTLKGSLQKDAKGAVVVSGIGNKVDSSHGVSVLGSKNIVNATDNIQLLGDNREVKKASGSVIIGSADSKMTTSVTNATILGHNANVEKAGGVALGAGSVASREAGVVGYDPATKEASEDTSATWKATDAAVSVGKSDGSMTRQITGVAAGTQATDAVNVAQLQKALAGAKDGNDTLKSSTDALKLDGNKLSMNIQDTAGHTVSGSVDLSKFAQAVDTNTTYTLTGQENKDNTTTITLEDNNGKKNSVTVATKDTRNTVKAGENVTLDTKDNADGSHEYTVNVKADGKVEAGSTKIVSGGTVYNETRVEKDGIFIRKDNTAGQNITALDHQLAANTESIYNINNRVSNLDNRINKVGAGAAALAALHPLDFNPDDKWDFAVGYGNYRNANSVAFGAFYRPNEDTMFSLGTNFGNGENMFNAGISFKIGKGNSYAGISKAQLVAENQQLKANDVRQDREIQELKKALEELKSRIK